MGNYSKILRSVLMWVPAIAVGVTSCSTEDILTELPALPLDTQDNAAVVPSGPLTIIDEYGKEVKDFSDQYGEYRLVVNTPGKWKLESSNDAVLKPLCVEGEGCDTVPVLIGSNWGTARQASLQLINADEDTDSVASSARRKTTDASSLSIYQNASLVNVHKMFSSNKGAGYSYMPSSNYCFGTNVEIFNMQMLDSLALSKKADLFMDEVYPEVEQEVITSDSEEGLNDQLSISASLGIDVKAFTINVKGSYDKTSDEKEKRSYAMERLKAYQFTREVNYMNIVALAREDADFKKQAFAAGYRMLEENLVENVKSASSSNDSTTIYRYCKEFVDLVGPVFISKAVMGCTLDYQISILNSSLKEGLTIKGALDITVKGSTGVKIEASGTYDKHKESIANSTQAKVNVRGGEVMLISILASGGTLEGGEVSKWQMSCTPEMATLIDMKLIPIYSVITDQDTQRAVRNYILKTIASSSKNGE